MFEVEVKVWYIKMTMFKKSQVTKHEVKEAFSWRSLNMKKLVEFEVKEVWVWRSLKIFQIEIEELQK